MNHDDYRQILFMIGLFGFYAVSAFLCGWLMRFIFWFIMKYGQRTEEQKKNDPLLRRVSGYFIMISGRLSVLFIVGGLVIMAADSVHSWIHADDEDPAVSVTQCMRYGMLDGTCEAS